MHDDMGEDALVLPDDVWIGIILFLDLQTLARCEQVSRPLRTLIHGSATIQYHKELIASGRLDRYSIKSDPPLPVHRLARLRCVEDALSLLSVLDKPPVKLRRVMPSTVVLQHFFDSDSHANESAAGNRSGEVEGEGRVEVAFHRDALIFASSRLQSGVLVQMCFAPDHLSTSLIAWADVRSPSQCDCGEGDCDCALVRGGLWALPMGQFHSWVLDSAADLIVLLRRPSDSLETSHDRLVVLSLRTGKTHPDAARSTIDLPGQSWQFRQLALAGDRIAVWDRKTPQVALVDWRTGEIQSVFHTPGCTYSNDIGFLAPNAYFVFREDDPAMEVCTFGPAGPAITCFRFPSLRAGCGIRRLCAVTWHHWYLVNHDHDHDAPRRPSRSAPSGSPTPYATEQKTLCLDWQLYTILVDPDDGGDYADPRGRLHLVVSTHGILRLTAQHAHATPPSPSPSSSSSSSSSPHVEIPWKEWGPRLTRFLDDDEARKSTRQFSGSKVLLLLPPQPHGARRGLVLKVMDFSPTARRYAQRRSSSSSSSSSSPPARDPGSSTNPGGSESDVSVLHGPEPEGHFVDALTPLPDAFQALYAEPVVSGLPYWTVSRPLEVGDEWKEFIVDDAHIVVRCEDADASVYAL